MKNDPVRGPARGVPHRRREDRLEDARRAAGRRRTRPSAAASAWARPSGTTPATPARARPSRSTATARPRSSTASRTSAPARARWWRSSRPRSSGCRSRRSRSASATRACPTAPSSGGSTTTPSSAPTIRRAAFEAKQQLAAAIAREWKVAGRTRPVAGGRSRRPEIPTHALSWAEACAKLLRPRSASPPPRARRQPRRRLEALHRGRPVRRGRGRHRDRQGPGREGRRGPRLRPRDQRADDGEPDPGRRHPGRLVRALREPGARPPDRPHGQPERRAVQDRRRARRAGDRGDPRAGLGRRQQHALGRDRRARRPSPRPPRSPTPSRTPSGRASGSSRSRRRSCSPPWKKRDEASREDARMKPFVLIHPRTLAEAARESARPDAELKAGGVDLLDRMKEGLDSPKTVVSISRIAGPRPESRRDRPRRSARSRRSRRSSRIPGLRKHVPRARRRGRRRRDAADPQHGDPRRQPLPAAALLVLPAGGVRLPQEGRQRLLRPGRREPVPRDLRHGPAVLLRPPLRHGHGAARLRRDARSCSAPREGAAFRSTSSSSGPSTTRRARTP